MAKIVPFWGKIVPFSPFFVPWHFLQIPYLRAPSTFREQKNNYYIYFTCRKKKILHTRTRAYIYKFGKFLFFCSIRRFPEGCKNPQTLATWGFAGHDDSRPSFPRGTISAVLEQFSTKTEQFSAKTEQFFVPRNAAQRTDCQNSKILPPASRKKERNATEQKNKFILKILQETVGTSRPFHPVCVPDMYTNNAWRNGPP